MTKNKKVINKEVVDEEVVDEEVVNEEVVDEEVVDEEVVNEEVVNEEVVNENSFDIIFNPPTIVNHIITFSATISNPTGIMHNGNMQNIVSISNDNASDIKTIIESIKIDTIAAKSRLAANKDWYK